MSSSSSSSGLGRTHSEAFQEDSSGSKRVAGGTARGSVRNETAASSILVSPVQKGNPVLKKIENVAWKFVEGQIPDYVLGDGTCALYLSMRYHLLHPDYLYSRIAQVKRDYKLKIVLCVVDIPNCTHPLILMTNLAASNDFTVIVCWSDDECARYLETFKLYEHRSATSIQEKVGTSYMAKLEDALTTIRSVNRTDAKVLSRNFGTLHGIVNASKEELALCSGIGPKKVDRLFNVFNEPFQ